MADFFEEDDEVGVTPSGPRWSTLKRSLIVMILLLLGAAATFAYMQLGDKIGPNKAEQAKLAEFDRLQQENNKAGNGIMVVTPAEAERLALEAQNKQAAELATTTNQSASTTPSTASSTEVMATSSVEQVLGLSVAEIKLKILNGSGVAGVGGKASKVIEAEGFKVSSVSNAGSFDYKVSEIRYSKDEAISAELIDQKLGGGNKLVADPELTGEIIVTLGQNFK